MGIISEHGCDISGTTAQRPTKASAGLTYYDTTTGQFLVWSGSAWQDVASPIGASIEAIAITGSDSILQVTGDAPADATSAGGAVAVAGGIGGATSGAGGAVSATGGAGTAGNSAGGASSVVGGAGQGSAAGGAVAATGGVGGATGAGGAVAVTGGAGGATSGTGGAVTISGGAGTAGNANGGALTLTGGAKHGSGTIGSLKVGSAATDLIGFYNATAVVQPASANQAALSLDVDVTGGDTVDKAAVDSNFAAIQTLVNQLRSELVTLGLIKGAA